MSKKILIVDDCIELRQLIAITLDGLSYTLSQASNADQALRLLADNRPDLIILDIMMPGKLNGFQLCEYVKNHPSYQSIKVILLTARSQRADVLEGIRVKSDAYIIKPFNPTLLRKKVDELLNDGDETVNISKPPPDAPKNSSTLEFAFPPRPSSLVNIQHEMNKETPDVRYVAEQIAADIALSAALLRTVNAPFYGLRNKVCSALDAVNLIGLTRTLHLVTAEAVRNSIPLPAGMEHFWDDTTKIAIMSASIAKHLALDANPAYLMGLFHDAAVPLMAVKHSDYLSAYMKFQCNEQEVHEAEQAKYNMNHAMLGGLLARAWYLPAPLIEAIRLHHSHELFVLGLDRDILNLVSVLLIADQIASQLKGDMDAHFSRIEYKVREHLNLLDDTLYQLTIDKALDSIHQA